MCSLRGLFFYDVYLRNLFNFYYSNKQFVSDFKYNYKKLVYLIKRVTQIWMLHIFFSCKLRKLQRQHNNIMTPFVNI